MTNDTNIIDLEKYPYKARFEALASVVKLNDSKRGMTAVASLDKLSKIFDEETSEKIEKNPDLLYIVSELIQLNWANLNGDCVLAEDIVPYADRFVNKYFDLEHQRSEIVGVITDVGYSLLGSQEIINEDIAINQIDPPAVLVVGGALWKLVNKELCELTETSSALNDYKISTSFELLFMSYDIGVGKDKNAKNAKIYKKGDEEFYKYDKLLKRNGGLGTSKDGDFVYCILKDLLPIGAGLVANPASGIKGILAITEPIEDDEEEENNSSIAETKTIEASTENHIAVEENNIILSESSVTDNNSTNLNLNKNMELPKIETVEDIASKWAELQKHESAASVVTEFIKTQLVEKSKEFAAELAKKEELHKTVEANKVEIEAKAKELEKNVEKLNNELAEIKAAQAASEAQDIFSGRMAALDEEFDLDDEDRGYLSLEVKAIESDEAFAKYMGKQKKLMAAKKKKAAFPPKEEKEPDPKDPKEKMETDEKCKASLDAKEVVASIVETHGQGIPNDPAPQVSLKDRMQKAFTEKTTIGGKKMNKNTK